MVTLMWIVEGELKRWIDVAEGDDGLERERYGLGNWPELLIVHDLNDHGTIQ